MCSAEPCQNVDVYEIGRHAYSVQHTWESDDHSQSRGTFSYVGRKALLPRLLLS